MKSKKLNIDRVVDSILGAFLDLLQEKDGYTGDHCKRVSGYAKILASDKNLGLEAYWRHQITFAASVHDLGKVGIPDKILNSRKRYDRNNPQDRQKFERLFEGHSEIGAKILYKALTHLDPQKYGMLPIYVLFHQWHYNSRKSRGGYPQPRDVRDQALLDHVEKALYHGTHAGFLVPKKIRSKDKNIYRLGIGILHVADSLDAATVKRGYKPGPKKCMSMKDAIKDIISKSKSRKEYHPDVVKALKNNKSWFLESSVDQLPLYINRKLKTSQKTRKKIL